MDGLADSLDTTQANLTFNQKSDARRYHALVELIDTEQNYVQALDVLVNVCLFFSLLFYIAATWLLSRFILLASQI